MTSHALSSSSTKRSTGTLTCYLDLSRALSGFGSATEGPGTVHRAGAQLVTLSAQQRCQGKDLGILPLAWLDPPPATAL